MLHERYHQAWHDQVSGSLFQTELHVDQLDVDQLDQTIKPKSANFEFHPTIQLHKAIRLIQLYPTIELHETIRLIPYDRQACIQSFIDPLQGPREPSARIEKELQLSRVERLEDQNFEKQLDQNEQEAN